MDLSVNNCRLCLVECSPKDVNVDKFSHLYRRATGFEVQDVDVPRKICTECQSFLHLCSEYFEKFTRTETVLQEVRESLVVDIKEEVIDFGPEPEPEPEEFPDISAERNTEELNFIPRIDFDNLRALADTNPRESEVFVLSYDTGVVELLPPKDVLSFDTEQAYGSLVTCPYCDIQGTTTYEVTKHATKEHPDEKWFQCPWCTYVCLSLDRLRLHCAKASTIKAKNHGQRLAPFSPLKCDQCSFQCCYQVNMDDHCQTQHTGQTLACECGVTFSCRDMKLQHLLTRCPTASKICKFPYERFINAAPKVTKQGKFMCHFCMKEVGKYRLQTHLKICKKNPEAKRERGKFRCDHCPGKSFKDKATVRNHMEGVHMMNVYPCDKCTNVYPSYSTRNYHILTAHDDTPYPCGMCGKIFFGKLRRDGHMKVHSQGRTHICQHCGKGYKRAATLKEHIQGQHEDKIKKKGKIVCTHCFKVFATQKGLKTHLKTHESKSCTLCQTEFMTKKELAEHTRDCKNVISSEDDDPLQV